MKTHRAGFFLVTIALSLLLLTTGALALNEPLMPHLFYGQAYIGDVPAPAGTPVEAWCPGILNGTPGNPVLVGEGGKFGGASSFDEKLLVSGDIAVNTPVYFFVGGSRALCREIGSNLAYLESYPYRPSQYTAIELKVGSSTMTVTATNSQSTVAKTAISSPGVGGTASGGGGGTSGPINQESVLITPTIPSTGPDKTQGAGGNQESVNTTLLSGSGEKGSESNDRQATPQEGAETEKPKQAGYGPILNIIGIILSIVAVLAFRKING